MPDIQKYLGNVQVVSGRLTAPSENEPGQYADRGYPYLVTPSSRYYQEYAKYASDYFTGVEAQGLDPNNAYKWEVITMRMADLVKTSAAMQRQFDNHKMVLLDKMKYAYVPRGAKFVVMGSVWLCTNPENISGGDGIGVVQRCNATWRHLDWYGNVLAEPFVVETDILRANAPDPQYQMNIVKGYFNVKCQFNSETAQINDNTRMIFGSSCYVVTGFSDFFQEFTGNDCSVRMLEFTIRKDEVNKTIDDLENHVAGGLTFTWEVVVSGPTAVKAGEEIEMSISSIRCNEPVASTEEHPINYIWESSDENVATVDENGVVTGVSEGECEITATLEQNPEKKTSVSITVSEESTLAWARTPPLALSAYETAVLEVTKDAEWVFSGADPQAYSVQIDGNRAQVSCWAGSIEPLTVTVRAGESELSAVIPLVGI